MAKTQRRRMSNKLPKRQEPATPQRMSLKVGRNEPCPCGSGKKYKECHLSEGEAFLHKLALEKAKAKVRARRKAEGAPWWRRLFAG